MSVTPNWTVALPIVGKAGVIVIQLAFDVALHWASAGDTNTLTDHPFASDGKVQGLEGEKVKVGATPACVTENN